MPRYTVTHRTTYKYSETITLSYNEAFVMPRSFALPTFEQTVTKSHVTVTPQASDVRERTDFFGNRALHFSMRTPHAEMTVTATSEVDVTPVSAEINHNTGWETVRDHLRTWLNNDVLEARQYGAGVSYCDAHRAKSVWACLVYA